MMKSTQSPASPAIGIGRWAERNLQQLAWHSLRETKSATSKQDEVECASMGLALLSARNVIRAALRELEGG